MKISTRSRYGLRMMLELALNYGNRLTFLGEIAKREGISEKYLGQLVILLKSAGLINAKRGARGGYTLARKPSEITLEETIRVLEGDLNLVDCVKDSSFCKRSSICATRVIWSELVDKISSYLDSLTLQDLVRIYQLKKESPFESKAREEYFYGKKENN
jgi:Rrf2 family protein